MHHADLDFDVTTGVRFHPLEILLSLMVKLGLVAALGPPAVAVLIFQVALHGTSMALCLIRSSKSMVRRK
jgi:sterol desaturase/sphingolipid hydroxylase (fatty acid hydroxylase superfamily)